MFIIINQNLIQGKIRDMCKNTLWEFISVTYIKWKAF